MSANSKLGTSGLLVSFEGIDGCGKSTQVALARDALVAAGFKVGHIGAPGGVLREPGGTPLGEGVRELLLHAPHDVDAWAEALLYAAARAQLVTDVLRPSLAAGYTVLIDRYVDSSLAYQGHARGLGIDAVLDLNLRATGGLLPDLTFVIAVDPLVARSRHEGPRDRIEREGVGLQQMVAEGFREAARRFPERIVTVDGAPPPADVAAAVLPHILAALRERHV